MCRPLNECSGTPPSERRVVEKLDDEFELPSWFDERSTNLNDADRNGGPLAAFAEMLTALNNRLESQSSGRTERQREIPEESDLGIMFETSSDDEEESIETENPMMDTSEMETSISQSVKDDSDQTGATMEPINHDDPIERFIHGYDDLDSLIAAFAKNGLEKVTKEKLIRMLIWREQWPRSAEILDQLIHAELKKSSEEVRDVGNIRVLCRRIYRCTVEQNIDIMNQYMTTSINPRTTIKVNRFLVMVAVITHRKDNNEEISETIELESRQMSPWIARKSRRQLSRVNDEWTSCTSWSLPIKQQIESGLMIAPKIIFGMRLHYRNALSIYSYS